MPEPIISAESIKIDSVELNSERFNKPLFLMGQNASSPVVAEINIYESLMKPYMTGNIILIDDHDLYRITDIQGTEKIKIIFRLPNGEGAPIETNFIVTDVESSVKNNETTSTLTLNIVEDIGYYNELQSISKSYQGTGEEIIEKILKDNLNRDLTNLSKNESWQKPFKYLTPYITPLEACHRVLDNMTTTTGFPFFLYSTIHSNDFFLTDLETILDKENKPFNEGKPFTYHQDTGKTNDLATQMTSIINFEGSFLENTLRTAKRGAIGADFTYVNVTTGKVYENHINMKERLDVLVDNGFMDENHTHVLIDDYFEADPSGQDKRKLGEFNSNNITKISSQPFPIGEYNAIGQQEFDSYSELEQVKNNILTNLTKNTYQLYVPGLLFATNNIKTSVGSKIELKILTNDDRAALDQKRSGQFLIFGKRHVFNVAEELHTVSLAVNRLTNQRNNA